MSDELWKKFAHETKNDPELQVIKKDIERGKFGNRLQGMEGKLQVIRDVIFNVNRVGICAYI